MKLSVKKKLQYFWNKKTLKKRFSFLTTLHLEMKDQNNFSPPKSGQSLKYYVLLKYFIKFKPLIFDEFVCLSS